MGEQLGDKNVMEAGIRGIDCAIRHIRLTVWVIHSVLGAARIFQGEVIPHGTGRESYDEDGVEALWEKDNDGNNVTGIVRIYLDRSV